jgi:hypothetical protein
MEKYILRKAFAGKEVSGSAMTKARHRFPVKTPPNKEA